MQIRLRFSQEYPKDFSEKEKKLLLGLIVRVPNNKFKEYEFDSVRMHLFKFYSLLLSFEFQSPKLEFESSSKLYFMNLYKKLKIDDTVLYEF